MDFINHYCTEVAPSKRKGIQHIYGGNEGQYSMKPNDFLELIRYIRDSGEGRLSQANSSISEKADGFRLIFGLDPQNRFFIESARSGPVHDEGRFRDFTIAKKGESDPISEGYEDILIKLKNDKRLQDFLQTINTPSGIKIQTEAFYLPLGKYSELDDSIVRFVATWYKKERLGKWATFVVINVIDGKGRPFPHDFVQNVKKGLKELSTDDIKFETNEAPDFKEVDLSDEIEKAEQLVSQLEKEYGQKLEDIVLNPSRKKDAREQKKRIKQEMLKLQKEFASRISSLIGKKGMFGDEYEGLVFELANGIMFKVVSDKFKEAKKAYNKGEL